jgi:uncharacterized membrane protein
MYLDIVVVAGIATVLLLIGFFVGVAVFIMKDHKAHELRRAEQGKRKSRLA